MYSTCLYCTRDLGANDVLETLPIGRRIVFDSDKGRLWVVCRSCAKWNLVPFDTRLETIDACERIFRDTRTRFSTDNIGLARVREGLDLVRIGAPQRPEFASWRYGAQYRRRRRQTIALSSAGVLMGAAVVLGVQSSIGIVSAGMIGGLWELPSHAWKAARNSRRRVKVGLPESARATTLKTPQIESAHIEMSGSEMRVLFHKPAKLFHRPSMRKHVLVKETASVSGDEARLIARRIAAALNDMVGSSAHLSGAIKRLESTDMERWIQQSAVRAVMRKPAEKAWWLPDWPPMERWEGFSGQSLRLGSVEPADRLALEMWLSEEDEAKALAGELALLERQWKEAEQLAKIADALAIPDEVNQRFSSGV